MHHSSSGGPRIPLWAWVLSFHPVLKAESPVISSTELVGEL